MKKSKFLYGLIIICSLQSCDSTQRDWETAMKSNTIESINAFIDKHPKSVFEEAATNKIDSLKLAQAINKAWVELSDGFSIQKLELFYNQYPKSIYSQKALNIIDSISLKEAIIDSKTRNIKIDTLHLRNLNVCFPNLNDKDKQDLITVLIERFNHMKGTAFFIASLKLAEGNDLTKVLRPSELESSGNITQESKDGSKVVVTFNGVLCGQYFDECLMIGRGDYFAKSNTARINYKGSYTIKKDGDYILFSTYYPKDALYFHSGMNGAEFQLPFGKNTVIRVKGETDNFFDGISIKSNELFPIHLILREEGLYYLMGKGEIIVNNNKSIVF